MGVHGEGAKLPVVTVGAIGALWLWTLCISGLEQKRVINITDFLFASKKMRAEKNSKMRSSRLKFGLHRSQRTWTCDVEGASLGRHEGKKEN